MYVILGASGQVGAGIVNHLLAKGEKVRAVVHNPEKVGELKTQGAEVAVADAFDLPSLQKAVDGAEVLFVLTPETGKTQDLIAETQQLLDNYRSVVEQSGVKKLVGLSSMGAHLGKGTGNLEMSYMLEHAFDGLSVTQVFVRPAYYFSNWMMYLEQVKEQGILANFYPPDVVIPMIAPPDVAAITAGILTSTQTGKTIYEIEGPERLTPADVAKAFSLALSKPVKAEQLPREQWDEILRNVGFTDDGIKNFNIMTEIVVRGNNEPEGNGTIPIKGTTTLQEYIAGVVMGKTI